jgi:alkaline phosphatase
MAGDCTARPEHSGVQGDADSTILRSVWGPFPPFPGHTSRQIPEKALIPMKRTLLRTALGWGLILGSMAGSSWAESVVYFIGDGMGPTQVTAARIYKSGAGGDGLTLDTMEQVGLVRTWAANGAVTDSAAAGTALASGVKTNIFAVGVDPGGEPVESMMVKAKRKGMSTGIVSTTRITHATPAAFFAHVRNRLSEGQIAAQLIESEVWDLVMGGGRTFFMTNLQQDGESDEKGKRGDGRDLIREASDKGIRLIQSQAQFDALAREVADGTHEPARILGLFNADHMAYELERAGDVWGEPSLAEMTDLAIRILSRNPNGYLLVVEGGRIDHAAHEGKAKLMLSEVVAMDDAVAIALAAEGPDGEKPLVVVTADHETGGIAINGYFPLEVAGDELLTDTRSLGKEILTFSTGPGGRRPEGDVDRSDLHYQPAALFYAEVSAHTGVDVAVYAHGPGSEKFTGTMDNTDVAKRIMEILGVE